RVDVVPVGERSPHYVPVRLVRADPEVDRIRAVPDQHCCRIIGGPAVHGSVQGEAGEHRRAAPHRLVQDAVDLHRVLEPGGGHVGLLGGAGGGGGGGGAPRGG